MALRSLRPRRSDNLEINWSGGRFQLGVITQADCTDNPAITPNPPGAEFDTYNGRRIGTYCLGGNCVPATIVWTFTDAGEGGTNDIATIQIIANGNTVLDVSGYLTFGNHQAHSNYI